MEQEDVGLALGLALGDVSAGDHRRRREPSPLPVGPRAVGPSLTLGLPAGAVVKRERAEEAGDEGDMLSSYSAATRAGEMPDDEDGGGNRKKLRLSKEQSALLEDRFKEHSTLNPKQKAALAKQLNLRPRQVEVWFQNRRARTKLKQTEVDYELLKRCCETLTEENRRLHRELQQLRALHRTTPAPPHLYMQFPAATLSICPSCECITPSAADGPKKAAAAPPPPGRAHFFSPFTNSAAC